MVCHLHTLRLGLHAPPCSGEAMLDSRAAAPVLFARTLLVHAICRKLIVSVVCGERAHVRICAWRVDRWWHSVLCAC